MEWREQGIVLGAKRHGETSAIVQILTRGHGRYSGLVRGGRSKRMRPVLQQGNVVDATWRARLEDHLGSFSIDPVDLKAATLMESPLKLAGLVSLTTMCALLPEREPHERMFDATKLVLENLEKDSIWLPLLVRWEAGLLEELGFGLDLSQCASTGRPDNLVFVSPKSGRAVSAEAGEPWRDKLLTLPRFLVPGAGVEAPGTVELQAGFALTAFFLQRHIFEPRGIEIPESRGWITRHLGQE